MRRLKFFYKTKDVETTDNESTACDQFKTMDLSSVAREFSTVKPLNTRIPVSSHATNESMEIIVEETSDNEFNSDGENSLPINQETNGNRKMKDAKSEQNKVKDISEFKDAFDDLNKFIKTEISNAKRSILYDLEQKINILKLEMSKITCTTTSDYPHPWKVIDTDLPANDLESFLKFEEILKMDNTKQEALQY